MSKLSERFAKNVKEGKCFAVINGETVVPITEMEPIENANELLEYHTEKCKCENKYASENTSESPVAEHDVVNHPSHYTSGRYEVIDIIEDQLGEEGIRGFCLGNALKYICRAGKKDKDKEQEDLEKAKWYLNRYLTVLSVKENDYE